MPQDQLSQLYPVQIKRAAAPLPVWCTAKCCFPCFPVYQVNQSIELDLPRATHIHLLGGEKSNLTSTEISIPALSPIHKPGRDEPLSKELYFSQGILVHRPNCTIKLNGKIFTGLMDMETDVTIINSQSWTSAWLTTPGSTALIGLGAPQIASQNTLSLPCVSYDRQNKANCACFF